MATSIVGIDAGGTETHVRMRIGSRCVFDRRSGRANMSSTPHAEILQNLSAATEGCPQPDVVAGCFAGLGTVDAAERALDILDRLFPGAEHRLAPDYVAVGLAAIDADVVVLAGTGSVVVSQRDGGMVTTGGLGHLLGDRGSAFRYGQALLEHVLLHDIDSFPSWVGDAIGDIFGSTDRGAIIRAVYGRSNPADAIARLAPTLSRLAIEDVAFARRLVDEQAEALARDVALHVDRYVEGPVVRTEVAGGVWGSDPIFDAFGRHLEQHLDPRRAEVTRASLEPVEGAIRLGSLDADGLGGLVRLVRPSLGR